MKLELLPLGLLALWEGATPIMLSVGAGSFLVGADVKSLVDAGILQNGWCIVDPGFLQIVKNPWLNAIQTSHTDYW